MWQSLQREVPHAFREPGRREFAKVSRFQLLELAGGRPRLPGESQRQLVRSHFTQHDESEILQVIQSEAQRFAALQSRGNTAQPEDHSEQVGSGQIQPPNDAIDRFDGHTDLDAMVLGEIVDRQELIDEHGGPRWWSPPIPGEWQHRSHSNALNLSRGRGSRVRRDAEQGLHRNERLYSSGGVVATRKRTRRNIVRRIVRTSNIENAPPSAACPHRTGPSGRDRGAGLRGGAVRCRIARVSSCADARVDDWHPGYSEWSSRRRRPR